MNRRQRIGAAIAVPVALAGIAFGSVYATGGFSRVTADFRGDQPLPNRNVEPLGPTRIEDMPR